MSRPLLNHASRFAIILIIFGVAGATLPVSATIFSEDGSNLTAADLANLTNSTDYGSMSGTATLFFDPECSPCKPVHTYIEKYLTEHPGTNVTMVDLSKGNESEDLMNEYYLNYHREWMSIPVLFIGPVGLEGTDEILTGFEGVYKWYANATEPAIP